MVNTPECQECDKLIAVQGVSTTLGGFLEWLEEQHIVLSLHHEHTENCYACGTVEPKDGEVRHWDMSEYGRKYTDEQYLDCGYLDGELVPYRQSIEQLLAKYFNIDLVKVEQEKQAILKAIRA